MSIVIAASLQETAEISDRNGIISTVFASKDVSSFFAADAFLEFTSILLFVKRKNIDLHKVISQTNLALKLPYCRCRIVLKKWLAVCNSADSLWSVLVQRKREISLVKMRLNYRLKNRGIFASNRKF